jgi:ribokinase
MTWPAASAHLRCGCSAGSSPQRWRMFNISNMVARRLRPIAAGVASGLVAGGLSQSSARADTSSGTWSWSTGASAAAASTASADAPKVVVVGSTNVDLIAYCPKLPRPGETLMGTNFVQCFGGKGANQAVMASKLGGAVTMVAKVGNDGMGEECKQNYRDCGVDTTYVYTAGPGVPTGVAPITVDETGENVIIVVSGANMELTTEELGQAEEAIASADVVVCQMEVPLEVTQKAMEMARAAGVQTVFNVAPCPVDGKLPSAIYAVTDVLCVNETELQTLAGVKAAEGDLEGYKTAAEACVTARTCFEPQFKHSAVLRAFVLPLPRVYLAEWSCS